MRWMLRSKIHRATVTETRLDYEGSITVDTDLLDKAGIWIGEKVTVANVNNGARFETYTFEGERGTGSLLLMVLRPAFARREIRSSLWGMNSLMRGYPQRSYLWMKTTGPSKN